jgi:hypothetical protein
MGNFSNMERDIKIQTHETQNPANHLNTKETLRIQAIIKLSKSKAKKGF